MEHLWNPAGATDGNRSQMGERRKQLRRAEAGMTRAIEGMPAAVRRSVLATEDASRNPTFRAQLALALSFAFTAVLRGWA
jgi:hypothetical protein